MLTLYTQYDRTIHQRITGSELAIWLDRRFPGESLFLYRHRETGTFVIGQMQTDGRFCDVTNLGHTPVLNREQVSHLDFLFSDRNTPGFVGRMMKANYDEKMKRMQDKADATSDRMARRNSTRISVSV